MKKKKMVKNKKVTQRKGEASGKREVALSKCCSFCGCDEESCKNEKHVKVYFCPKCKSQDVGFIFGLKNIFGIIPRMRCRKCGFTSAMFPQLVVSGKKLTELNKKYEKRGKK